MFRTRQKKVTAVVIGLAVIFLSHAVAVGRWTRGNFEVHVFQVGQADSQLIVGPTGRTLLIDVGELSWNSSRGAQLVAIEGADPTVAGLGYRLAFFSRLTRKWRKQG